MNQQARETLARLLRMQRIASLGTLRNGTPEVTLVLYVASQDCTRFYLHLSGLAHHTQNLLQDPRVSLMIAEPDAGSGNPQALARVTIRGEARRVEGTPEESESARTSYLAKFPEAAMMFSLGDFALYSISAHSGRLVAGFAQAFNLSPEDFRQAAVLTL